MNLTNTTFVMIKTDAITNGVSLRIIEEIIRADFSILHYDNPSIIRELHPDIIAKFYKEHVNKPYYPDIARSVTKVIPMILTYNKSQDDKTTIPVMRKLIGATDPRKAEAGTIRNMFGGYNFDVNAPTAANAIHASDSTESAMREIEIIFPEINRNMVKFEWPDMENRILLDFGQLVNNKNTTEINQ